jgi:regulatory protein
MATPPVVTALRRVGRARVAVELDGAPWRVLPAEPVLAAGIDVGVAVDRTRARRLRSALRETEARRVALAALDRSDHTAGTLRARLAARGVAPAHRETVLETMARAGLVDDRRFATERAAALARRGSGDLLIRDDLERRGVSRPLIDEAVAALEPERDRARRLATARGLTPRTLRRLGAKGFTADSLDELIADWPGAELG